MSCHNHSSAPFATANPYATRKEGQRLQRHGLTHGRLRQYNTNDLSGPIKKSVAFEPFHLADLLANKSLKTFTQTLTWSPASLSRPNEYSVVDYSNEYGDPLSRIKATSDHGHVEFLSPSTKMVYRTPDKIRRICKTDDWVYRGHYHGTTGPWLGQDMSGLNSCRVS